MVNYILKKYYYFKYLWTIKKSIGSLAAIREIESGPHQLIKEHKVAEIDTINARNNKPSSLAVV